MLIHAGTGFKEVKGKIATRARRERRRILTNCCRDGIGEGDEIIIMSVVFFIYYRSAYFNIHRKHSFCPICWRVLRGPFFEGYNSYRSCQSGGRQPAGCVVGNGGSYSLS